MSFKEGIKRVAYCIGTVANYASIPIGGWAVCDAIKYYKEYQNPDFTIMAGAAVVYSGLAGLARRRRDTKKATEISKLEETVNGLKKHEESTNKIKVYLEQSGKAKIDKKVIEGILPK